jgi:hypothetical protein
VPLPACYAGAYSADVSFSFLPADLVVTSEDADGSGLGLQCLLALAGSFADFGHVARQNLSGRVDHPAPPGSQTPLRTLLINQAPPPPPPPGPPPPPPVPPPGAGVPARVVIEPDDPDSFRDPLDAPVRECFDRYWRTGGRTEALLRLLADPRPAGLTVQIEQWTEPISGDQAGSITRAANVADALVRYGPAGQGGGAIRGPGTSSTIGIYPPQIAEEADKAGVGHADLFCALLLHELVHAIDNLLGSRDAAPETLADGNRLGRDELKAAAEENYYRRHTPVGALPARTAYGTTVSGAPTHPLPADVVNGTRVFPLPPP